MIRLTPCDCPLSQHEQQPWPNWLKKMTRVRYFFCNGCQRTFFKVPRRRKA